MTPRELLAHRNGSAPNGPGWSLRVVPNQFPVLRVEGTLDRQGEGLFDKMNGIGAHEVIIETPRHEETLATMGEGDVEQVLWAFRERVQDLKQDQRLPLHHHLQEPRHGRRRARSTIRTRSSSRCRSCRARCATRSTARARTSRPRSAASSATSSGRRRRTNRRVIAENADMVAVAPYAPRFPFETWILPKRHQSRFEDAPRHEYASLGAAARRHPAADEPVAAHAAVQPADPQRAAARAAAADFYHWHVEIIPTLTKVAGFEWATGFYLNPTSPEEAAQVLREARV